MVDCQNSLQIISIISQARDRSRYRVVSGQKWFQLVFPPAELLQISQPIFIGVLIGATRVSCSRDSINFYVSLDDKCVFHGQMFGISLRWPALPRSSGAGWNFEKWPYRLKLAGHSTVATIKTTHFEYSDGWRKTSIRKSPASKHRIGAKVGYCCGKLERVSSTRGSDVSVARICITFDVGKCGKRIRPNELRRAGINSARESFLVGLSANMGRPSPREVHRNIEIQTGQSGTVERNFVEDKYRMTKRNSRPLDTTWK